jgi:4-carboxymuconolactone decarboxylase
VSRFTPLERRTLTADQQRVVDEVRSGRRGTVPANVVAWLPSPQLARRAAHLGEFVRYETSLPPRLSELAILAVARRWSCAYEWAAHAGEAAKAGIATATIEAIGRGERPALSGDEAAVFDTARELAETGRLSEPAYAVALAALGETGLTDLIGVVGYYTLVAFTLNVRDVPAPPGTPRLPERSG